MLARPYYGKAKDKDMKNRVSVIGKRILCVGMTVILLLGLCECIASSEEYAEIETEDSQENTPEIEERNRQPQMDVEICDNVPNTVVCEIESGIESCENESKAEQIELENHGMDTLRNNNYFLDLEDLEKNHKILTDDICSEPKYDYENTPLVEIVEETIVDSEEMSKKLETPLCCEIDYHLFDFNDDGIDDYLLCIYGENFSLFPKDFGSDVSIFIQEEEGVRKVLFADIRLSSESMLTVLDEKTGGYYAIVPSYGNYILRYDTEQERYDFGVRE